MQLSQEQQQDIVKNITHSATFGNAPTLSALLKYLHDATLKGTDLKEGVIDIEFFGTKGNSEKSNPKVRVNIYNLRKKLVSYYAKDGINDKWQLHIEKGQYHVSFTKSKTKQSLMHTINWPITLPYLGLFIALLFITISNIPLKKPAVWESFFTEEKFTNLYIGDVFGFVGPTPFNKDGWTRDYKVNSLDDFYRQLDKRPELKNNYKPAPFTFTTGMAGVSVQHLQKLYQTYDQDFAIRYSTKSSIVEITEGNSIYIGIPNNNNKFINFFNNANPYCEITRNRFHISNHPEIRDTTFNIISDGKLQEYAIVSKYPATGDTEHFVFFSKHDIGVSAAVEYFTDNETLEKFADTYLKEKKYFTAIFSVKGQERIDTDIELKQVVSF